VTRESGRGRVAARPAAVALLALTWAGPTLADVRPLTLYQKSARAALVVRARAMSDSTRRPPVEILEVYKGIYSSRTLYIVPFLQDYANPKPWLRREVFRKGEEYVLFLNPYEKDPDRAFDDTGGGGKGAEEERPDQLFVVLNADQGMSLLPSEGAVALTEAIRRFVAILALGQHDLQAEALRGLLTEKNPNLVEAGLSEVERFDLAEPQDLPVLLQLLGSVRAEFRGASLRVIGQICRAMRVSGRELRERQEIFTKVVDRAYNDQEPSVRSDAVGTLADLGGTDTVAVLRAVSDRDPDQQVRYRAQVVIIGIEGFPSPGGSAQPRD
jgi:hypothetical protein